MSEGRSRISYEEGNIDIYNLSAAAIEEVEITAGEDKPIQVNITMNNSAGLFQVDELLKSKLKGSGLEQYIAVKAYIESESEKSLIKEFIIE
jgi:metal-dependent HD superfamily phosphatase/phosphodiesterase